MGLLLSFSPAAFARTATASSLTFPATAVGSSSLPQTVDYVLPADATVSSITASPSLGGVQEYIVGAVAPCVVDGMTVNPAGTHCIFTVTFSPAYPGSRPVPLTVVTSTGNVSFGLNGVGTGPQAVFVPGTLHLIAGGSGNGVGSGFGGRHCPRPSTRRG